MASIDKLLVMGCVLRVFIDGAGNGHYSIWSPDYKIEVQYLHEQSFTRFASRLYLLQEIKIPTGELYQFFRLVRQ